MRPITSLNPFEIRAGLKHGRVPKFRVGDCLNPFEIRAGLKHLAGADLAGDDVLIPLKSGLA